MAQDAKIMAAAHRRFQADREARQAELERRIEDRPHIVSRAPGISGAAGPVPGLHLRQGVEALLVPGAEDLVEVGPLQLLAFEDGLVTTPGSRTGG